MKNHFIKTTAIFCILIACLLCGRLWAKGFGDPTEVVKAYQEFPIDINKDGQTEKICLLPYNHSQNGFLLQIVVLDKDGELMWKGPRIPYMSGQHMLNLDPRLIVAHPMVMGHVNDALIDLCYINPEGQDGFLDAVICEHPKKDNIMCFRVLKWDNGFKTRLVNQRFIEDTKNPDHYIWTDKQFYLFGEGYRSGRWIKSVRHADEPGKYIINILEVKRLFSGDMTPKFRRGIAIAKRYDKGLYIDKWEKTFGNWTKYQ